MGKSTKQKFLEQKVDNAELKRDIELHGTLPVSRKMGVSEEALRSYAKQELGISDPKYLNVNYSRDIEDIVPDILIGMFTVWKDLETRYEELEKKYNDVLMREQHKKEMSKVQLIEMLEAVNGSSK